MRLKPAERITLLAQLAANALDFQHSSHDHNDPHEGAAVIVNAIDAKAFNAPPAAPSTPRTISPASARCCA
jgi:ParB family chromosome partitioning protein